MKFIMWKITRSAIAFYMTFAGAIQFAIALLLIALIISIATDTSQ